MGAYLSLNVVMRAQKRHDVSTETTKAWVTPRAPQLESDALCGQVLLIRSSVGTLEGIHRT